MGVCHSSGVLRGQAVSGSNPGKQVLQHFAPLPGSRTRGRREGEGSTSQILAQDCPWLVLDLVSETQWKVRAALAPSAGGPAGGAAALCAEGTASGPAEGGGLRTPPPTLASLPQMLLWRPALWASWQLRARFGLTDLDCKVSWGCLPAREPLFAAGCAEPSRVDAAASVLSADAFASGRAVEPPRSPSGGSGRSFSWLFFLEFWDHTWQCSGALPGSAVRGCSIGNGMGQKQCKKHVRDM